MTILRHGVHTASELQRSRRLLDRRRHAAEHIISAMRHGASLHLHYENGRPLWWLSTGELVDDGAVRLAIAHPSVAGCGDSLFARTTSQSYRWIDDLASDHHPAPQGGFHG